VNSASTLALLAAANCSGVAYIFNLQISYERGATGTLGAIAS